MKDFLCEKEALRFLFPIDGDCLNARDGTVDGNGLTVRVALAAPIGARVTVNGVTAEENAPGQYGLALALPVGRTVLKADCGDLTAEIAVFRLRNAVGKYRLSVDDNILFLADITAKRDVYRSIFDNPYLALYREAHEKYGAKVHLNLFYAYDEMAIQRFGAHSEPFDLSMVTDRFRDEWAANADWLRLGFHSRTELPGSPYRSDAAEEIAADFLAVKREVERFAGPLSFAAEETTVHCGSADEEAVSALRRLGVRTLAGFFELNRMGRPSVSYYATPALALHVGERDFWYDCETDMRFARIDRVLNVGELADNMRLIEDVAAHPGRGGFVSIMIHEQYFYSDYIRHLPDYAERILAPCRYLAEQGYTGAFLCEIE